jgi:hypothetical protein
MIMNAMPIQKVTTVALELQAADRLATMVRFTAQATAPSPEPAQTTNSKRSLRDNWLNAWKAPAAKGRMNI